MSDELKPVNCGCGGEARILHPSYTHCIVVMCPLCGIKTAYQNTESEAITAWNRAMGQKTGEWIEYPDCLQYENAYADDQIVCSACHHVFNIMDNCTEEFDFCPHCGAEMKK